MTELKVYKVRDKDTGLYSSGGSKPKWSKKGKTWGNKGAVTNHLNMFCNSWSEDVKDLPEEWEIVEMIIKEEDVTTWPARIVSDALKKRVKIKKKYGWNMSRGLEELKNIDMDVYRYCFEIRDNVSWGGAFEEMLGIIKELGIKRENYRYRTPIIVFNNINDAFIVKLSFGEKVRHFVDLVELEDLLDGKIIRPDS